MIGKKSILCASAAAMMFANTHSALSGTTGFTSACRIGDSLVYLNWGAISNDGDGGGFWVTDATGLFTIIEAPNAHHFPITARDGGGNNWRFSEAEDGAWIILLETDTKGWEQRATCDRQQ